MGIEYDKEYDPLTGVTRRFIDEGDGSITIKQSQDMSGCVEYAKNIRNDPGKEKENWHQYAIIPNLVQEEMYKKGIDVARDGRAVFQYVNAYYPALKLTNKWHDSPKAKKDGRIIVK